MTDNEILSTDQKIAGFRRWMTKIIYKIFYQEITEENRSEIFQILGREIMLAPLYRKIITPINTENIDKEQEKILFKSRLNSLISNNISRSYNKNIELLKLADSFYVLNNEEIKASLPCFIR